MSAARRSDEVGFGASAAYANAGYISRKSKFRVRRATLVSGCVGFAKAIRISNSHEPS